MTSFMLKLIAIVSMTIDHIGFAIFPETAIFRRIGRMAMPLFAFQIALGFKHTSSRTKYIFRILLIAILSEIPYMLLIMARSSHNSWELFEILKQSWHSMLSLNICFTFFMSLLTLCSLEMAKKYKFYYLIALYCPILALICHMDYDWFGIILVVIFYYWGDKKWLYTLLSVVACTISCLVDYYLLNVNSFMEYYMFLAYPLLYLYNGQKGKGLKYLFYAFYPLHMLLIVAIKIFLLRS